MKRRKRMLIFIALVIIMLYYFPNSLIAEDSQDKWGVKEGDEFTFSKRVYIKNSEQINTDCEGLVKVKVINISATGILTYNMTSNTECSENFTNESVDDSIYNYVLGFPALNLEPEEWSGVIEYGTNRIESWILDGSFNGTYSSNIDSLGYSFIIEGFYLDPNSIEDQIITYRYEMSVRYKSNGVLQKSIAAYIMGDYIEERSTLLVEESNFPDIPGIPTNFLIGTVGLSILGLIFKIRKKKMNF